MQFTVFTSILDESIKKNIATEMLRVVKTQGIIIWYDYYVNNPKNHDVKKVRKEEIYNLFSNCEIHLKRITLAPSLARAIAPCSMLTCYFLEKLIIFNTHYLGIIKKVKLIDNNLKITIVHISHFLKQSTRDYGSITFLSIIYNRR